MSGIGKGLGFAGLCFAAMAPCLVLAQDATSCLKLSRTSEGRNGIMNTCTKPVRYAFCGSDAGVNEPVGVCGRDIGGSLLAPGQTTGLTQGNHSVRYYYLGCFSPYTPLQVRWTGSQLTGKCER